jgi:hypothetical protein
MCDGVQWILFTQHQNIMNAESLTSHKSEVAEKSYDSEDVSFEAMKQAKTLIETTVGGKQGVERHDAVVKLMESMSPQNENRHVVHAMAEMLTVMKGQHELHVVKEKYPLATQAVEAMRA